jgi:hypothetical protein
MGRARGRSRELLTSFVRSRPRVLCLGRRARRHEPAIGRRIRRTRDRALRADRRTCQLLAGSKSRTRFTSPRPTPMTYGRSSRSTSGDIPHVPRRATPHAAPRPAERSSTSPAPTATAWIRRTSSFGGGRLLRDKGPIRGLTAAPARDLAARHSRECNLRLSGALRELPRCDNGTEQTTRGGKRA